MLIHKGGDKLFEINALAVWRRGIKEQSTNNVNESKNQPGFIARSQ